MRNIFVLLLCLLLVQTCPLPVLAQDADNAEQQEMTREEKSKIIKEKISIVLSKLKDEDKTNQIFVNFMDEDVNPEAILKKLLPKYKFQIEERMPITDSYLVAFESKEKATEAVYILNESDKIYYAEINMKLQLEKPLPPYSTPTTIEKRWYDDAVFYMKSHPEIFQTVTDETGLFDDVTRGEFTYLLWKLDGSPSVETDEVFPDVLDAYYTTAVAWAKQNGIVSGYSSEVFKPDGTIAREQIIGIFYNYAGYKQYHTNVQNKEKFDSFADAGVVSACFVPAVEWACGNGLMKGADGLLLPKDNASLVQTAVLLQYFAQNLVIAQ